MTTTTIALIRHGQTDWNLERRIQGRTDIPLNATGVAQAEAAALALADEPWHALFTSPLDRAAHTASVLASGLDLGEPVPNAGFLERDFGQAEGLVAGPDLARVRAEGSGHYLDAETPEQVAERGIAALEDLRVRFPGQRVLVVSHGACIRLTLQGLLGEEIPGILNAERTQLEHSEAGWRLTHLNGLAHGDAQRTAQPASGEAR